MDQMEFNFTIPIIGMEVEGFMQLLKDNGYKTQAYICEKQFTEQITEADKQAQAKQLNKHGVVG